MGVETFKELRWLRTATQLNKINAGVSMKSKGILLLILLIFFAGCKEKAEFDYWQEALNLQSANDKTAAEDKWKEGLQKYPHSELLKDGLFEYYTRLNRWDLAEEYYGLAGGSNWIPGKLASHYFETKEWAKAFKYYMDSGSGSEYEAFEKKECGSVAVEAFRNAAAAASNMNDRNALQTAYNKMMYLAKKPVCLQDKPQGMIKGYVSEVQSWLPKEKNSK